MILFALVVLVSVISINDAFAFKTISDDSTGGDCSTMGTWDSATKTCTLTSDLSDGIVITSNGITLDGNGTTISGTYMLTYDPNSAIKGILLDHTTGVTIKNTLVKNFNFGIYLETSDGNTIQSNTLTDNKSGIFLHDSDNNKINLNTITTNPDIARDGLVFINSDGNIFSSNIVSGFIYGIIDEGYSLSNEPIKYADYFDVKVTITDNTFKNSGGGVALSNVKDSTIQGNTIESNEKGIVIDGKNITIKNNFIKENKGIGLELYFPDNTIKVYNNKFIDNKIQMYISANEWTKSQVGGNYWNNFDELSEGCKNTSPFDKFCDSPFIFKGGKDEFPLILQNGGIPPPQIDTVSPVEPKPKTDVVVPSTDTDNDGISDPIDQCPTQAETVNGFKDTDGCPDVIPTNTTQLKLPLTFKKTALSWADGKITDYEFLQRVQIEINRGTMVIPEIESDGSGSNEIPSWIKNNAGWWAEGTIDDDSFVQGIQFLIKEGIMKISTEKASDVAKAATVTESPKKEEKPVSKSGDSVIASLESKLEKCSEIVKSYVRLDCEKPIKQEILVHTYKTGAKLFQVGPINYYWFGVNSEGNTFEISPTGQPILNIRMLADNTSSGIVSLNCTSPAICNYDVWDGSKSFKYSGMDFTSGQINLNPGTAKEFNILFGPNIGYGGTEFEYDSSKDYTFRINEPFGSLNVSLDLK